MDPEAPIVHGHISCGTLTSGPWDIGSDGHLLPSTNASFDIGSAEKKVRHLFLSDNSLTVGSQTISEDNLKRNLRLVDRTPPTNATAQGEMGQCIINENHLYACTATNQWVRLQLQREW
jgi:hypothetical protein